MAPSGNNIPQRFRQRIPSPTLNDLTKNSLRSTEESVKSNAEAQKQWEDLLDRRKKCKERHFQERYDHIKKELTSATTSLAKLDRGEYLSLSPSILEKGILKNYGFMKDNL